MTSRASAGVWSLRSRETCLLLGKYAPATARLFVEFRRVRDELPPAQARMYAARVHDELGDEEMMTMVRAACVPHGQSTQKVAEMRN